MLSAVTQVELEFCAAEKASDCCISVPNSAHLSHWYQGLPVRLKSQPWVSGVWFVQGYALCVFIGFSLLCLSFIWKCIHNTKIYNYIFFVLWELTLFYLEENVRCTFPELHSLCYIEINGKNKCTRIHWLWATVDLKKSAVLACALSTQRRVGCSCLECCLCHQFWAWLPALSKLHSVSNQVWIILVLAS